MSDNRLGHTRVAALALAGAAVDDVLAWCLLAWVSALVSVEGRPGDLIQIAVLSFVYVAFMVAVARPVLARFVGHMSDRGYWRALFVVLCAGALLSAYATTWIGIHAIFGAFAFGFITPREPARALAEHVATPLNHIATILLPVFFIVTGLSVDLGSLGGADCLELAAILVVATAGKMIGATVPARLLGLPWREARILGLLMNTRGLTELIILNAALSLGVLDGKLFTMMVIMALFTTALAGPLLPREPGSLPGAAELIPHRTSSGAWGKLGAALTPPSGGQR
nr:cation:proton antiporter [Kineosporia sp. NBRC 101731]